MLLPSSSLRLLLYSSCDRNMSWKTVAATVFATALVAIAAASSEGPDLSLDDGCSAAEYWETDPWDFGGEYQGQVSGEGLQYKGCAPEVTAEEASSADVLVSVDASATFQTMEGFGAAMTESSAYLIHNHPKKQEILDFLFGPVTDGGAGISLVRLPVSMLSDFMVEGNTGYVYSAGPAEDGTLEGAFSIERDMDFVIPVLKAALEVNPELRFWACPWSAPSWMKDVDTLYGYNFNSSYTSLYAEYLRRYVESYAAEGINIDFVVPQNEPGLSANGYPTMVLTAEQEKDLVKAVAQEFSSAGLDAIRVVIYSHNWDDLDYAREVLSDPEVSPLVGGVAFHCYSGDYTSPARLQEEFPGVAVFLEECTGTDSGDPDHWYPSDLSWAQRYLYVGQPTEAGAGAVMEWNLALDQQYGPCLAQACPAEGYHCGCQNCRGLITVTPDSFEKNVEAFAVGHSSAFVPPGSALVSASVERGDAVAAAYLTPSGRVTVVFHALFYDGPHDVAVDAGDGRFVMLSAVEREASVSVVLK